MQHSDLEIIMCKEVCLRLSRARDLLERLLPAFDGMPETHEAIEIELMMIESATKRFKDSMKLEEAH